MLGERSDQRGLWEADRLYLDHVGRDTFYGLLATALLFQTHDKVSDAEAKARADFDIRWKSLPSATIGGGLGD